MTEKQKPKNGYKDKVKVQKTKLCLQYKKIEMPRQKFGRI